MRVFVVFEGIDGGGKTTLSNLVAKRLRARGLSVQHVREGIYPALAENEGGGARAFDYFGTKGELAIPEPAAVLAFLSTRAGSASFHLWLGTAPA